MQYLFKGITIFIIMMMVMQKVFCASAPDDIEALNQPINASPQSYGAFDDVSLNDSSVSIVIDDTQPSSCKRNLKLAWEKTPVRYIVVGGFVILNAALIYSIVSTYKNNLSVLQHQNVFDLSSSSSSSTWLQSVLSTSQDCLKNCTRFHLRNEGPVNEQASSALSLIEFSCSVDNMSNNPATMQYFTQSLSDTNATHQAYFANQTLYVTISELVNSTRLILADLVQPPCVVNASIRNQLVWLISIDAALIFAFMIQKAFFYYCR